MRTLTGRGVWLPEQRPKTLGGQGRDKGLQAGPAVQLYLLMERQDAQGK